ncbi:MAG: nuclear transport factor 2 family protein [Myxococcales bacterium]
MEKYVEAFHRYDVDALTSLLRDDVNFSMPPYTLWLRGRETVRGWLLGPRQRLSRLATRAARGVRLAGIRALPWRVRAPRRVGSRRARARRRSRRGLDLVPRRENALSALRDATADRPMSFREPGSPRDRRQPEGGPDGP